MRRHAGPWCQDFDFYRAMGEAKGRGSHRHADEGGGPWRIHSKHGGTWSFNQHTWEFNQQTWEFTVDLYCGYLVNPMIVTIPRTFMRRL